MEARPHNRAKTPRYGELPDGTAGVIEWHANRVFRVARGLCDVEDLVAVGTARAMAEVGHYDASKGTTLKTWCSNQAWHAMRNYVYKLQWVPTYKAKENARNHVMNPQLRPISQLMRDDDEAPIYEAVSPTNEFEIDNLDSFEQVRAKTLGCLKGREREIAEKRWLGGATLREIAKGWGVTLERVRQIETRARKRITDSIPTREHLTGERAMDTFTPPKPVNSPISAPEPKPSDRDVRIMALMEVFLGNRPRGAGCDEGVFVYVNRKMPDVQRSDITRLKYVRSKFRVESGGRLALASAPLPGSAFEPSKNPEPETVIESERVEMLSLDDWIVKLEEQHALLLRERDAIDRHAQRIARMIAAAAEPGPPETDPGTLPERA